MIRAIVDHEKMTLNAIGEGFVLISEATALVETLLKDIAKGGPHPNVNYAELADMFCYNLIQRAKETD